MKKRNLFSFYSHADTTYILRVFVCTRRGRCIPQDEDLGENREREGRENSQGKVCS